MEERKRRPRGTQFLPAQIVDIRDSIKRLLIKADAICLVLDLVKPTEPIMVDGGEGAVEALKLVIQVVNDLDTKTEGLRLPTSIPASGGNTGKPAKQSRKTPGSSEGGRQKE